MVPPPPKAQRRALSFLAMILCAAIPACSEGAGGSPPSAADEGAAVLEGRWRASLLLDGGEVPFTLWLGDAGAEPAGAISGAGSEVPVAAVELEGRAWVLGLGSGATELVGRLSPEAGKLEGFWRPADGAEGPTLPFVARRLVADGSDVDPEGDERGASAAGAADGPAAGQDTDDRRATASADPGPLTGSWVLTIEGVGERQRRDLVIESAPTGTIALAEPGEDFAVHTDGDSVRLTAFDGERAVLLVGRLVDDGTLEGAAWSAPGGAGSWSAERR